MLASAETLQLIHNVLGKKGYIDIPAYGFSMYPYIQKGDLCRFIPIESTLLQKGDVVLYITESGQLIGHRFHEVEHTKEGQLFRLKGDSNLGFDAPVSRADLIGKLICIQRGKKVIEATDVLPKIWRGLVLNLPWLSRLLNRMAQKKRNSDESFGVGSHVRKMERS